MCHDVHPGRIFTSVKCLSDPKEFECLSNFDEDMYFDILDFMRYFVRTPEELKKDGRLDDAPNKGIPGFKCAHSFESVIIL